jgi:hypothetical protein
VFLVSLGVGAWTYRKRRKQAAVSVNANPGEDEAGKDRGPLDEVGEDHANREGDKKGEDGGSSEERSGGTAAGGAIAEGENP